MQPYQPERKADPTMAEIGCFLSSEEHGPLSLVNVARAAEEAGFDISILLIYRISIYHLSNIVKYNIGIR